MRIAGLIAVSIVVAGCSQSVGGEAEPPGAPTSSAQAAPGGTTPTTGSDPTAGTDPTGSPATTAPPPGAPIGDVVAWIEQAQPADPDDHHVAFRDQASTPLGEDVAFTAPSGSPHDSTQCMTDSQYREGTLICLTNLDSPAPRPAGAEGLWKPGWIEFNGADMLVGSLRGDPGPFVKGAGPELPPGRTLTFGDFRCRSDSTGLACVNYAHRTAAWISAAAVVPYGCLQPVTAPTQVAQEFSC